MSEATGDSRLLRSGRALFGCAMVTVAWVVILLSTASAYGAGSISGTVTDAVTEAPIEGAEVCAISNSEYEYECGESDQAGEYLISELAADEYRVEFWASYLGYAGQMYDGKTSWADADLVAVADAPVTGIDAALFQGGRMEGTVTDAATSAAIEGVEVCASSATEWGCTETDAGGTYVIPGMNANEYVVEFWGYLVGYETQFYDGRASLAEADPVSVALGAAVPGIDARLTREGGLPEPPPIVTPPTSPPPLLQPSPPPVRIHPKPKRCRKGFRRKRVRGKVRCVKVKKKHRRSGRISRR